MLLKSKSRTSEKFAAYLRLSSDDGDRSESYSIKNQRELIKSYSESHPDVRIVDEYVDDGYTGTNFDRPAFIRMVKDIESGKINGVIVKDLSRFGRDYIGVGKYLEKVFPTLGIRFIAINDNYDNASENSDSDSIIIPFKNLLNDSYARDISIKIRSQLEIRRKNGDYTGAFAPYGYKKDENNVHKLVIDDYAADVVRDIFNWKIDGMSPKHIADKLNEMGIPCPSEYKRLCGLKYSGGFKSNGHPIWQAPQVIRILVNEVYIGNMVQGKIMKANYKLDKYLPVPEENWIRVNNTHEPIVSKYIFDLTQELMKRDTGTSPNAESATLFSGIVKCADCGQNMIRRKRVKKGKEYIYLTCGNYSEAKACTSHLINANRLEKVVIKSINQHLARIEGLEEIMQTQPVKPGTGKQYERLEKQMALLDAEIEKYTALKAQLYNDKVEGVVSAAEYEDFCTIFDEKIETARSARAEVKDEQSRLSNIDLSEKNWVEEFKKYKEVKTLSRRMLVELVESITVYDKAHVHIKYRFSDELGMAEDGYGISVSDEHPITVLNLDEPIGVDIKEAVSV